jgi:hypothetical protein
LGNQPEKKAKARDYFIYCTNVQLTSAANGGKDRATTLLQQYQSTLGLLGFDIWDGVKLASLIDQSEQIRKRFVHLFTPGDLLAALAAKLESSTNLQPVLAEYLTRSLFNEEETKLSQAGDRTDNRILLSKVFVDLPFSNNRISFVSLEHYRVIYAKN